MASQASDAEAVPAGPAVIGSKSLGIRHLCHDCQRFDQSWSGPIKLVMTIDRVYAPSLNNRQPRLSLMLAKLGGYGRFDVIVTQRLLFHAVPAHSTDRPFQ
jgi:hypothetical protein